MAEYFLEGFGAVRRCFPNFLSGAHNIKSRLLNQLECDLVFRVLCLYACWVKTLSFLSLMRLKMLKFSQSGFPKSCSQSFEKSQGLVNLSQFLMIKCGTDLDFERIQQGAEIIHWKKKTSDRGSLNCRYRSMAPFFQFSLSLTQQCHTHNSLSIKQAGTVFLS